MDDVMSEQSPLMYIFLLRIDIYSCSLMSPFMSPKILE
jgi:hypothetical protein